MLQIKTIKFDEFLHFLRIKVKFELEINIKNVKNKIILQLL